MLGKWSRPQCRVRLPWCIETVYSSEWWVTELVHLRSHAQPIANDAQKPTTVHSPAPLERS